MTRHLLHDPDSPLDDQELSPEEASARWERLRIMPCENCTESADGDVIIYHEAN